MKYLIGEKLPDGRYKVRAWINADGSETPIFYSDVQEAVKLLPMLDKATSGLAVDSDHVSVDFDGEGNPVNFQARVYSKNVDDPGLLVVKPMVDQATKDSIAVLKSEVYVKAGVPEPVKPKDEQVDPISDVGAGADDITP